MAEESDIKTLKKIEDLNSYLQAIEMRNNEVRGYVGDLVKIIKDCKDYVGTLDKRMKKFEDDSKELGKTKEAVYRDIDKLSKDVVSRLDAQKMITTDLEDKINDIAQNVDTKIDNVYTQIIEMRREEQSVKSYVERKLESMQKELNKQESKQNTLIESTDDLLKNRGHEIKRELEVVLEKKIADSKEILEGDIDATIKRLIGDRVGRLEKLEKTFDDELKKAIKDIKIPILAQEKNYAAILEKTQYATAAITVLMKMPEFSKKYEKELEKVGLKQKIGRTTTRDV